MTHIFLYGPSGSGKSTIGKQLAYDLKLPFIDSDQVIEINVGMSIPEIVELEGMSKVRDFETEALRQIIAGKESVIALGGGALLRDENRGLIEQNGNVILLKAEHSTLMERLEKDLNKRPLLAGDLEANLKAYLESRIEHYTSFPLQVVVDNKSIKQISKQVQVLAGRHHLSAMGEYDVIVGSVFNVPNLQNPIIVTDENVAKYHLEKIQNLFNAKAVIVPAGEAHKNLETISFLWKSFLDNGLDRKSTVIALGGGVIGDMAGFAASTYMRGIDWIGIPTTLLSMVDASLGGKTGFDLPEGKNIIGSFYPPKLVLADPSLLLTLPDRELRSGMAEVVKHGIISDPDLFAMCQRGMDWVKDNLEDVVKHAMAVKIKVIEEDPYEKGIRAALNLGHTVGHAVELVSKFELRHGEAIAIGTAAEARYAARVGLAAQSTVEAIESTFEALGLPIHIPEDMPREKIIQAMRVDKKKNAKSIRFALPVEIGKVELVDVTDLEDVLQ
jgi:3-dehydroquinate synthase